MTATNARSAMQMTLEVGPRLLCVDASHVSVFPRHNATKSYAAWVETPAPDSEWCRARPHVTYCVYFPGALAALIQEVLHGTAPVQVLMDWCIEYGPANLARELEAMCS